MGILIASKRDGFRRAGIEHSSTPTLYADDRFTPEQLDALEDEPMLIVHHVDDEPEGVKAKAAEQSETPDLKTAKDAEQPETLDPKAAKDAEQPETPDPKAAKDAKKDKPAAAPKEETPPKDEAPAGDA